MKRITTIVLFLFFQISIFAQPSNDECATLIELGEAPICPILDTFNNVNATASVIASTAALNVPSCFNGSAPDNDVWFSFTIPADGSLVDVQIELDAVAGPNGGIVQPQMAIYRGDCSIDGLQELDCVAALAGETSLETLILGLIPGFIYYLRIEDWSATAASNPGDFVLCIKEPDVEFNMGDVAMTSLCSGTLYDSGGPTGDYSNGENNTFTICPTDPHECININIANTNIENTFDNLTFYAGPNTGSPQFLNFTGAGGATSFGLESDCVTIGFTSDFSVVSDGWELTWECTTDTCVSSIITCANPDVIPSLPFSQNDLSTCGTLNSQTFGPCPFGLGVLDGEDYIFTYDSQGDECISVILTGSTLNTAVSIYDDCPENATNCMGVGINLDGDSAIISSSYLQLAGTYYIVVDNGFGCTDFNIEIDTVTCPIALPAAALCDDALSINGCGNLPSLINVAQQPTTQPDCIQTGVNSGGWGGIGAGHFTWFYFQAQADGNFGFLANNGNIFEDSDIDINVWGPISTQADLCTFMKVNEPARSSFAADNPDPLAFDFTGLIDINPVDGTPVLDEIEGAGGDGFVSTLPVVNGQWYLVLVNDFSGAIVNGGIQMDFSSTTPGVLDPALSNISISQDLAACEGVPFTLEATGGAAYSWFPAAGLSCTDCPNPTVVVNGPTTYQVAVSTACSIDTLAVEIAFMEIDAGDDMAICQGETLQLGAQSNLDNVIWDWEGSNLSCTDCPNPILDPIGLAAGTYQYIATASTTDCSDTDTVQIIVLSAIAPDYVIADDQIICEGENIDLGGASVFGVTYMWTANVGTFTSDESNPNVTPTQNITYYLQATNIGCPNPILDSVQIEIVAAPVLPIIPDEVICAGEDFTILNITTTADVAYSWSPSAGIGDPTLANNVFTPTQTTTYTLTASRGNCSVEESFTIQVNPAPVISVDDVTTCAGMEVILTGESNVAGTFTWQPDGVNGSTFSTGILNSTMTYTLEFVDDNNCAATSEMVTVTVEPGVEIISITSDPAEAVFQGNPVTLTVETNPTDNLTYNWSTGGATSSIVVNPLNVPNELYAVTVIDENGCIDSASISIEVLGPEYEIPNAFTPDQDGVNDVFGLVINGENIEVAQFQIFNRWGEKVFDGGGTNITWDGTVDGKDATSDVYVYLISIQLPTGEEVVESGDVTLIR